MTHRTRGFSVIELLVVCGIIAVLISIIVPVVNRIRGQARLTLCASNLRELSHAFNQYIAENRGIVPRYGNFAPDKPIWVHKVMNQLHGRGNWTYSDLPKTKVLQCPVHPNDLVPTGFSLNVFAFESRPDWRGSPAMPASLIRNGSKLPWLLETPDWFYRQDCAFLMDDIYCEWFHVVYKPEHLPGGSHARISYTRHGRRANVLYFDGHVDVVRPGQLQLEDFDDGVRSRTWD